MGQSAKPKHASVWTRSCGEGVVMQFKHIVPGMILRAQHMIRRMFYWICPVNGTGWLSTASKSNPTVTGLAHDLRAEIAVEVYAGHADETSTG